MISRGICFGQLSRMHSISACETWVEQGALGHLDLYAMGVNIGVVEVVNSILGLFHTSKADKAKLPGSPVPGWTA